MKIHQLSAGAHKAKKRIGRGGKRGTTSGRGTKGQKSRAGRRIRPALRDLIIRIPKRRGFRNKPKSEKAFIISFTSLVAKMERHAKGTFGVVIDQDVLRNAKIVPRNFRGTIKIIGKGEVSFPMNVRGIRVSEGVRAAIEKAGGKVSNH